MGSALLARHPCGRNAHQRMAGLHLRGPDPLRSLIIHGRTWITATTGRRSPRPGGRPRHARTAYSLDLTATLVGRHHAIRLRPRPRIGICPDARRHSAQRPLIRARTPVAVTGAAACLAPLPAAPPLLIAEQVDAAATRAAIPPRSVPGSAAYRGCACPAHAQPHCRLPRPLDQTCIHPCRASADQVHAPVPC